MVVRESKPYIRQQVPVSGDRLFDTPGLTECIGSIASNGLSSALTNCFGIKLVEVFEDSHPLPNLSWRIPKISEKSQNRSGCDAIIGKATFCTKC